ncbi:MAG: hypothetical protein PVH39_04970, partial [Syntrophobacterales bacterium]
VDRPQWGPGVRPEAMVDGVKYEYPFGGNSSTITKVIWCRSLGRDCYLKGEIVVKKVRNG